MTYTHSGRTERGPRGALGQAAVDVSILDDTKRMKAADPGGMLERIKDLGHQVREGWDTAKGARLPKEHGKARDITVLGMGGSAIGADFAAALLAGELRVPMLVHRDYGCPNYVGADSLVIASSYSGNTEETLSGVAEARRRGAKLLGITTGGELASQGQRGGFPIVRFAYAARPRAALGWSLALVMGALGNLGYVRDLSSDVWDALADFDRYASGRVEDDAKELARHLFGRIVGMYGAGVMGVMARRWKGQWNENAKNWSFFDVLPELDHNAIVGFPNPDVARQALAIVVLRSAREDRRTKTRHEVTVELLGRAGVPVEQIEFGGVSPLAEVLKGVYLGDHVSYYLTLLNGADPSPNETIDYLKNRLAEIR